MNDQIMNSVIHPSVRVGIESLMRVDAERRRQRDAEAEARRQEEQAQRARNAEDIKRSIAFIGR